MKRRQVFLLIAAAVFVGWLGWLAYLASAKTNPVVVSRSQMMAANHFVLAEVKIDPQGRPEREVTIKNDLRPVGAPLSGMIRIDNIASARVGGARDFREPGLYLLPLTPTGNGSYILALQPRSPGQENISYDSVRPWAYYWDAPGVKDQFDRLVPKR